MEEEIKKEQLPVTIDVDLISDLRRRGLGGEARELLELFYEERRKNLEEGMKKNIAIDKKIRYILSQRKNKMEEDCSECKKLLYNNEIKTYDGLCYKCYRKRKFVTGDNNGKEV